MFCGSQLRSRLTNYTGFLDDDLPILSSHVDDNKIVFDLNHSGFAYTLKARGTIDITTHALTFEIQQHDAANTPVVDALVVRRSFLDLSPYMQLYCPKKDCPHDYQIASATLFFQGTETNFTIDPVKIGYESFTTGKLWVQNYYPLNNTYIYNKEREEAKPIITPIMNLRAMGKDRVLNRIRTLVVFS